MPEHCCTPMNLAAFRTDKPAKVGLFSGEHLLLGLNCFEAGQSQPVHSHAEADKFYLILSGNARMIVGTEHFDAATGTVVWSPRGVPHGVERAHERTVMLVGIAPPPAGKD